MTSVRRVAGDVDALRERLAGSPDPLVAELVESLRTTVDQLQTAEEELERRNEELLDVHSALAAEARRFQLFFEAAPVAYLVTDRRGTIAEANAATAALLGSRWRFLQGKPLAALVDVASRRTFRRELLRLREDGERMELVLRMRRRGGVAFDASVRAVAIGDSLMWSIADITDRRQAEEQLWALNRELEERAAARTTELEIVIDQIPVGLVFIDADGRLTRVNERARAVFGDDAAGRMFAEWPLRSTEGERVPTPDRPAARALRGEVVSAERLLVRDAVVEVNAVPIRSEEAITGAVLTFEDVTERERRARADREFVTNAAHQLRNPIAAITSVIAALHAGANDDEAARERFLALIERDASRMTRTVESLLRLARLERDGRHPELRLVPLRPLLEEVADAATPRPGVDLPVDCAADVASTTNEGLVVEILSNLVENAAAHTEEGEIALSARLDGDRAVVEVFDTGSGIPTGSEALIFDRFYSGPGTSGTGAGLGLALSRAAAAAVGGTLEHCGDNGGRGAKFRLTLPGARIIE